ncbi:MAG TPA: UDP-N-acetylmuramoyl-tripeptide--D-alanyl-D-alanine ligase [Solirubrobacteraceae bacterium]
MIDWDAARLAQAAGARLLTEAGRDIPRATGPNPALTTRTGPRRATIDSRQVQPGDLFIGLAGEREDGGLYARQALQAGAWGVLVIPEHAEALAADAPGTAAGSLAANAQGAVLVHPDPLAALQALASAWRQKLGAKVVAITGSTGKTSTKDILAAVLSGQLRTVASPQNLNTEIGLPLAVLAAPPGTEALVLEMAMRGPGQIAELMEIAQPDVGLIVNVGPVHLELLGSLEAVAAAKAELIAGLKAGSTVVLPYGEPLLAPHLREDLRTVTFGDGGNVRLLAQGAGEIVVGIDDKRITLRPSFAQSHNLRNLLAAVAGARALGVTPEGRVEVAFSALRGQRIALQDDIVLIDDCYNANPMSMRAALDDLAASAPARRVAVLGDMLELGSGEKDYHREVGAYAQERGVELLLTVGPLAAAMGEGFQAGEIHCVTDAAAAAKLLPTLLRSQDTVLVKGSRGVGLERVGQILEEATPTLSSEES